MKKFIKIGALLLAVILVVVACDKIDKPTTYSAGMAPTLTASTNTVAASPADSSANVLAFSWTDPKHQTSTAYKYILQFDTAGNNFENARSRTIIGKQTDSLTGKELNDILLGLGFSFGVSYSVDARLISSYANNNEQLFSNTVTINATPYRVPPKIDPPASGTLFLVGGATQGGWTNPVPVPTQQFGQIDETTFVGVFDLVGGGEYLILPVNGNWDHKYSVAVTGLPGLSDGGDFGYDLPGNFPGPATSGLYKIIVDFQTGRFSVTPYTGPSLPTDLFIVGDATPGGWTNPVPVPSQQFTRINSVQFEITLSLDANKQYLLLPVNGDWSHKYAVEDTNVPGLAGGGFFGYDLSGNFPGPADAGTYKIEVNFGYSDPADPAGNSAWFKTTRL